MLNKKVAIKLIKDEFYDALKKQDGSSFFAGRASGLRGALLFLLSKAEFEEVMAIAKNLEAQREAENAIKNN